MAKYKVEIDNEIITKTLTFMGREFIEKWMESGTFCQMRLEAQVMNLFPDLSGEEAGIIEQLTCMDEDELLDALSELSGYEQYNMQASATFLGTLGGYTANKIIPLELFEMEYAPISCKIKKFVGKDGKTMVNMTYGSLIE